MMEQYLGDPTTPGYPSYENATRTEGENIPKIPSLPLSWANAQRLLLEISNDGDARILNGKTSERKIKIVNHGMSSPTHNDRLVRSPLYSMA